jgi:acetyl esterase
VRVRVYRPSAEGPLPVLVYAHGGGWCAGDLDTHDTICRRLATDGGQIVVAVDYRRAPEHRYPAGHEDLLSAWRWVEQHAVELGGEPERVAIGGDSAGGNLAAAVCLSLRESGAAQPAFQWLVYPATDLRCGSASHREFGEGYVLTAAAIQWYLARYGADPTDPRASVLLAADLRGLAPAIIATAGFDPLRDEGEAYAERLRVAGVQVEEHRFPGLVHGFLAMDGVLPSCERAVARLVEATRRRWAASRAN